MLAEANVRLGRAQAQLRAARQQTDEPVGPVLEVKPEFDPAWYLERYPDVAKSGADPLRHYEAFGRAEGREPGPKRLDADLGKRREVIDAAIDAAVAKAGSVYDALAQVVENEAFPTDFDQEFYLQQYPDIAARGFDPAIHFVKYGRAEGRLGMLPQFPQHPGHAAFDPARANVLVICHEASLTGAPILGLNLVQALAEKYNVVTLLLGDGPLTECFGEFSCHVGGPLAHSHSAPVVADAIGKLADRHAFKFAIVNSIDRVAALESLARRSIPSVALIHEFASYTRPESVFQDAFFWATEIVFSTPMTYQDALAQHPGLAGKPCRVLPQGH
jgi:hypothetical protein